VRAASHPRSSVARDAGNERQTRWFRRRCDGRRIYRCCTGGRRRDLHHLARRAIPRDTMDRRTPGRRRGASGCALVGGGRRANPGVAADALGGIAGVTPRARTALPPALRTSHPHPPHRARRLPRHPTPPPQRPARSPDPQRARPARRHPPQPRARNSASKADHARCVRPGRALSRSRESRSVEGPHGVLADARSSPQAGGCCRGPGRPLRQRRSCAGGALKVACLC
jgi:hypothetical protein